MLGHMFPRIKYFLESSQMFLSSLMHLFCSAEKVNYDPAGRLNGFTAFELNEEGFVIAGINFSFFADVLRFVVTLFLKKKEIFIKCNLCALSFVSVILENGIRPLFFISMNGSDTL